MATPVVIELQEGHHKVDENGAIIIAEASWNKHGLCCSIFCLYVYYGIVLCCVFLPCACILGIIYGYKAAAS